MKNCKMLVLAMLLLALVLSGCSASNSAMYENDLSFDGLTEIEIASAANSKGRNAGKAIDGSLKSAYNSRLKKDYIELSFDGEREIDTLVIRENGWKINAFCIEIPELYGENIYWNTIYQQDTAEDLRVCSFDAVKTDKIRISVNDASSPFSISEISVYHSNQKQKNMRVTGYLRTYDIMNEKYNDPENDYYLDPDYFSVLNQVIIFSGVGITDEGEIVLEDYLQNGEFENCMDIVRNELIGENDTDMLVTLSVSKNPLASMVENREKTIKNIVDFLVEGGFKGISFDWEFPKGREEYDAFSDFLVQLKKALAEKDLILSCAFYSWGINLSDEAIQSIDQIEIMGYDIYDRVGNNAGFLGSAVQPIKYFLDKGAAKDAISLGLPIFGRTADSEPVWRNYDEYDLRRFDNVFYDSSFDEPIYFNSAQMIEDKVAYAVLADVGGIMLFHIKNDLPFKDENSLIRVVGKTLNKYTIEGANYEAE